MTFFAKSEPAPCRGMADCLENQLNKKPLESCTSQSLLKLLESSAAEKATYSNGNTHCLACYARLHCSLIACKKKLQQSRCMRHGSDLARLFAASDFPWRSVRYLHVKKTDEPTLH